MTVISTRDFHAHQSHYLSLARRGEHVVLRSRLGRFQLTPIEEEESRRDITAEVCEAMKDWKDFLEGDKSKMLSWEEFLDAVQD